MDQQKKHRKVLRAAFTKSANELDKLLSEEAALQQVQVAWEVLLQKHENLLIANKEIYDALLQEDKHIDIGLDEDDRRSRASLAVSKSTLGPVPGTQSENNGGANPESSTMSRLESLMSFVKSEVENEERISLAAEGFGLNSGLMNCNIVKCIFCEGAHGSENCFKAHKYSLEQKRKISTNKKACFRCLKTGHQSRKCHERLKCLLCGKQHVTLMCPELPANKVTLNH
ncbi:hypothetical protein JTB14_032914 [Gonioctena quinquepunctata]|nr:hypothetical protein JTB14_032914 [Gonioctena quinquepunctata]